MWAFSCNSLLVQDFHSNIDRSKTQFSHLFGLLMHLPLISKNAESAHSWWSVHVQPVLAACVVQACMGADNRPRGAKGQHRRAFI